MPNELRTISKEDIAFLKDLQHERLTQHNDYCAEPVIWFVAQEKEVPAPDGCGDKQYITDGEGNYFDFQEAKEHAKDNELDSEENIDSISYLEDMADFLNEKEETNEYRVVAFNIERNFIDYQPGCFLTKRSCKDHIEANDHHYSNGHTYGPTAWRNPEFERLMKIIETIDFDAIQNAFTKSDKYDELMKPAKVVEIHEDEECMTDGLLFGKCKKCGAFVSNFEHEKRCPECGQALS